MALPNGDLITTVFDPQMAYPVDKRMQVDTLNSRDSMSMFIRWEGMEVYVLENSKKYILQGGRSNEYWKETGTGTGTGGTTFVGQFPTADLLPTSGRSAGDYAFVGTGDDFVQYNWDNIANEWVMAEGQTDMASEFFHIGYKTPLRRPVIFPLFPKDVLVQESGDFVFSPETSVARFIFVGEVEAIRGIETAAADREIKLVNRTGSDIPLRDKASGIPSDSGFDFGGTDYTWVNGSEITLKGNGTYWELAPNNQIAFSDHLDSVNAQVSVGSDGLEVITDIYDKRSGRYLSFKQAANWVDGTAMDDTKVDGVIFLKYKGKYFVDTEFLETGRIHGIKLGLDRSGIADSKPLLEKYIKIGDVVLDKNSTYILNTPLSIEQNKLIGKRNTVIKSNTVQDTLLIDVLNGGGIRNLILDGDNKSAKGVAIRETGDQNDLMGVTFKNFYGENTDSYGARVYTSTTRKVVKISSCIFQNILGRENATVGDLTGASRGILVGGGSLKTRIENCDFDEVGNFEDGDQIVIATEQDENGTWAFSDTIIDGNTFNNVKKRGVKVMASGVRIQNNKAFSNYTDANNSPQAAYETYADDTYIGFNEIRFSRALSGIAFRVAKNIKIIGNDIEVDKIGVYNTQTTKGTTSYAIRGYTTGPSETPSTGCIKLNTIDSSRGILLQNCHDMEITSDNTIYGSVYVNQLCKNITVSRNIFKDYRSTFKPSQRIILGDVENCYVYDNNGYGGVNGIGLGQASFTIAKNWHIFRNKWLNMTGSDFVNILTDQTELFLYDNILHYDYIGDIYASNSGRDPLLIDKDGIYVFSGQLPNLPDASRFGGANWFRVEQKSVYPNTNGIDKQLTATVINSAQNDNYPFLRWYRNKRNGVWGNWSLELSEETLPIAFTSSYHTLFPIQTIDTAQHTFQPVATERYTVFTGGAGNAVVTASRFVANKELNGEVQGGDKTFIGTSGMTLRGGNLIAQSGQRFSVKFYTPTDALVTIYGGTPTVPNASTTQRGIIEQATDAEAITGTDTERAVSPANLQAKLNALILSATATLDFPTIAAGETEMLTATVTGADLLDPVIVSAPADVYNSNNSTIDAWVSAANTVTVRVRNNGSSSIDPGSGSFKIKVFK